MNCIVLKLLFSYSGSQFKLFIQPLKKLQSSEQVYKLLFYNIKATENKTPKKHSRILVTMAIKISWFISISQIYKVNNMRCNYYNSYFIHTLIKQRNKTANGSTQSCIFYPSSKHQTLDVPFTRRHMHTSDTDTHVHMHNHTATYMSNPNQNSSKHIIFFISPKT